MPIHAKKHINENSTKHLADVRKLLEFQRGRTHRIDFTLNTELVF